VRENIKQSVSNHRHVYAQVVILASSMLSTSNCLRQQTLVGCRVLLLLEQ
jgi:hypothetical protein